MSNRTFFAKLRKLLPGLQRLQSHESTTVQVNALYGQYRLTIGAEYSGPECDHRQLPPHSRPIDVNGAIDHLYIENHAVTALPSRSAIDQQMKATMILHGLTVSVHDPDGSGRTVSIEPNQVAPIRCTQILPLDDCADERVYKKLLESGQLTKQTYQIIQEDILRMLRQNNSQTRDRVMS